MSGNYYGNQQGGGRRGSYGKLARRAGEGPATARGYGQGDYDRDYGPARIRNTGRTL